MTVVPAIDQIATRGLRLPRGRIALLTNHAARTRDGHWSGEVMRRAGYDIVLYLAPEHGLRASAAAGVAIPHTRIDNIPVLSMYGADRAPLIEALATIDLIAVDLPDVGCRYYTYNWTVRELMKLAEGLGRAVVILDRPNPLGGEVIEGNAPETTDSPVCSSPVPIRHGLTIGELARFNQQYFQIDVELEVLSVRGWERRERWRDFGCAFVPPSPNLRSPFAVALYPGACLLEGTNTSEGRGTARPFQTIGAPFVDAQALAEALGKFDARPTEFVPIEGKWSGQRCYGVTLEEGELEPDHPVELGLELVSALRRFPGFEFHAAFFDRLAGGGTWRQKLEQGAGASEIAAAWRGDEARFRAERESVLLYG